MLAESFNDTHCRELIPLGATKCSATIFRPKAAPLFEEEGDVGGLTLTADFSDPIDIDRLQKDAP